MSGVSIADLLRRAELYGWTVALGPAGPQLVPLVIGMPRPPFPLVDAFRRFRDEVVAYLAACPVCGRDVSDPGDRERLKDPAHCDRGGARAATDGLGVYHEASERCPFKD